MSIPELNYVIFMVWGFWILNISKYMLKYMEICSAPSYGVALLLPMVSHWVNPESVVRPDSFISRK